MMLDLFNALQAPVFGRKVCESHDVAALLPGTGGPRSAKPASVPEVGVSVSGG